MKTFLIVWSGQLVSLIGSGLTSFALGIWIFQETRQATPFALTVLFGTLPRLLLTPVAGSVADRWNRRWLMILADFCDALVTLAALLLFLSGGMQVWHIYLIAAFSSAFASFQEPAYTASVTMLVPKQNLARAAGLMQMGQAVEMLIAPLLAGALFGVIGIGGIIAIDFITFFFAIGALAVVHIPQPPLAPEELKKKASIIGDIQFGWGYLVARPGLFGLLSYYALVNFLLNFASVLGGPLVLSIATATALGAVQMVGGLGMLLGSVILSAWGGPKRRINAVIGFISLGALGLALAGLFPHPASVGAGLFILLFSIPLASGPSQAIFQSKVAASIQGRVFAIRSMISRSMMPLAFLISGPLADLVFEPWMSASGGLGSSAFGQLFGAGAGRGIGLMYVLAGLILAAASAVVYLNPRIRNLEDELPDAIPEEAGEAASAVDAAAAEPGPAGA